MTESIDLTAEHARVPVANQPGHHPPVEQDKPFLPPKDTARADHFRFSFDAWMRPVSRLFAITPESTDVVVGPGGLSVRFGPWSLAVPHDQIAGWEQTGPYQPWKVAGPPHLSFKDHGLTFATNRRAGVCVRFTSPRPGIEPLGLLRHPAVTLTVADPEAFCAALERRVTTRPTADEDAAE